MFQTNSFVRVRRRNSEAVLLQLLLLALLFFLCMVGVVAFLHFSGSGAAGAPTKVKVDVGAMASAAGALSGASDGVEVIIPNENIEAGATLDPAMFRRERRPSVAVDPEMIRDLEEVKGLYSKGVLVANQPVHRDFLTTLQPVNALTASIPTGYRAIAIAVDATTSVEGWAAPGARVDLIWVTSVSGKRTASVLAPNAKVLSANRRTEASNNNDDPREKKPEEQLIPTTVTLLLTTRDSLRVRLASLHGRIALVLRGTIDGGGATNLGPITESGLVDGVNAAPTPAPRSIVTVTVKDRKTGSSETMSFEHGERLKEEEEKAAEPKKAQ